MTYTYCSSDRRTVYWQTHLNGWKFPRWRSEFIGRSRNPPDFFTSPTAQVHPTYDTTARRPCLPRINNESIRHTKQTPASQSASTPPRPLVQYRPRLPSQATPTPRPVGTQLLLPVDNVRERSLGWPSRLLFVEFVALCVCAPVGPATNW
jgi:hypothetical protein